MTITVDKFDASSVSLALQGMAQKGSAKGSSLWGAVLPLFAAHAANGNKAELESTTSKHFSWAHAAPKGALAKVAKAYVAACAASLAAFKQQGRAKTQEDLDDRLLHVCSVFTAHFPDFKPRPKFDKPTTAQQLAITRAELAATKAELAQCQEECQALKDAIDGLGYDIVTPATATTKDPAKETDKL